MTIILLILYERVSNYFYQIFKIKSFIYLYKQL